MAFTSLLLKSYMIRKPSLTADTLEDVMNQNHLLIAAPQLNRIDPIIYNMFSERIDKFFKLYPNEANDIDLFVQNPSIIKEVQNKRAVILCPTNCKRIIKQINSNIRIMESEIRYKHRYIYTYFNKNVPNRVKLIRMIKSLYETGILVRDTEIMQNVMEIYAKTEPTYTGPKSIDAVDKIYLIQALRGPFAILIMGFIITTMSLLGEFVYQNGYINNIKRIQ